MAVPFLNQSRSAVRVTAPRQESRLLQTAAGVAQGQIGGPDGLIDVADRAIAQTSDIGIVFFAGDVISRLAQQLHGSAQSPATIQALVKGGKLIQVLAVIEGSRLISLMPSLMRSTAACSSTV